MGLALFSTGTIIITYHFSGYQLDKDGLDNLFTIFALPIKLFVATFLAYATWLTLHRTLQTKQQLEIITDNNVFNNYYKHIDEFIKHLSGDPLIISLSKDFELNARVSLVPLYKSYYSNNYKLFTPSMLPDHRDALTTIIRIISRSKLNEAQYDLFKIPKAEVDRLFNIIDNHLIVFISTLIENHAVQVKAYFETFIRNAQTIEIEVERYKKISYLFWVNSLYSSILMFEGINLGGTLHFPNNYGVYRNDVGLVDN